MGEESNNWQKFTSSVQNSWNEFSWEEFKDDWEPWSFKKKWYWAVLFYLGCYILFWWTLRTLQLCARTCCGTKCSTKRYGENSWAVVTGSTDGIGKAACMHLAKLGFNIVFISRTLSKLEKVAKEVEETAEDVGMQIQTKVVAFDFSKQYSAEDYEKLYNENLADLDISILINNVGMAATGPFIDMPESEVHNIVTANVYSVVLLSQ